MPKAAHIFSEQVVAEEIARLRFKRADYQSELDRAMTMYNDRKTTLKSKTRKWIWGAWLYATAQLGIGSYGIFGVEWIGWDLVEPVTYTAAQGGFIIFMFYIMRRSRLSSSDYGDI